MIILLFLMLMTTSVFAMESDDGEGELLLGADTSSTPAVLQMQDEPERKEMLFDGTRRYFDQETENEVRCNAKKRCACETALCTCYMGSLGLCCSFIGSSLSAAMCVKKWWCYFAIGTGGMAGTGTASSLATLPYSYFTENANAVEKVAWDGNLRITPEMLAAADDTEPIGMTVQTLKKIVAKAQKKREYGRDDCFLPCGRRILTCYYCHEKSTIAAIAHRVAAKDDEEQTSVTQKELFMLLNDLVHHGEEIQVVNAYARAIILAHNGWLSLARTEKYPFRCHMRYFDDVLLPEASRRWYANEHGPAIYLPFDITLAAYYKFEEDPQYQNQFSHPSSPHLSSLLRERLKFAPQAKLKELGLNADGSNILEPVDL